ncbi:HAD family hydrolase [Kaistia algarum]|uniref:HAD family hydrolase n=1 Tax=Kaistia algarum TaxID=2083279 RepID=UPI000CE90B29|nr:HAD family hydrolase [Kaistia algarum]MCX5512183.1 HAD family hydrolase [Kaistia algarum]PPE80281.1 HAD family hydrolase [Kaistia algarum]
MIQAVLFDLDETLIDRAPAIRVFVADQYRRCAEVLAGVTAERYSEEFLEVEQFGRIAKKLVYPQLAAKLGLDDGAAEILLNDYTAHYPSYATLRPEARPTLDALQAAGMPLGIITNGVAEVQFGKIDALGLRDRFEVILVSSVEGISKPEPAIFRRAAERLALPEASCLFVGDNPAVDVIAAEAAGMLAAWLENTESPWPAEVPPPRHSLATLADVLALVPVEPGGL